MKKQNKRKFSLRSVLSIYHISAGIVPVFLAIVITLVFIASLIYMIYYNDNSGTSVPNNSRDVLTTYCCHFNIRSIENKLRRSPDKPDRFGLRQVYKRLESYGLVVCVESEDEIFYISEHLDRDYFYKDDFSAENHGFVYLNENITAIRDVIDFGENNTLTVSVMSPDEDYPNLRTSILEKLQFSNEGFMVLLLLVVFAMVLVDILLVRSLTRIIQSSITNLGVAAKQIKEGNLDAPVGENHYLTELDDLAKDFDEMRQTIKAGVEMRKEEEKIRLDTYSGINHDSRTAITTIKGYTQGIIEGIANTPEKQERYLNAIYNSALTLEKLMNAFSDVTNLENSEVPFNMREKNMHSMIEKWYQESKEMFEERKIILKFTYNYHKDVFCNVDDFQFERIIENLLSNSVKYKKPESEYININIIARINEDLNMFELIYKDDGVGIRPDETERIFDRFYRSNEARSNVQNGSGVGLAIVKQIILKHSGTISASGTPGQGLQLTVHLPITNIKESD
ncbi:MAG: HAMP domain-containing histidine kinase [Ruminococcaceae bacterium]|nr:HAMP domain-containing histidine kinase [Oscillospiraceae bacterium]